MLEIASAEDPAVDHYDVAADPPRRSRPERRGEGQQGQSPGEQAPA
jgi:hypothetical protein